MNPADLFAAVRTRLTGDATLTGLVSGVYQEPGPAEAAYPYITMNLVSDVSGDAYTVDVAAVEFDVHVWAQAADGDSVPGSIVARVIGDATTRADRTPTHGLHRHVLGAVGTYYGDGVLKVRSDTNHSEDVLNYVLTFKTMIHRVAPSS